MRLRSIVSLILGTALAAGFSACSIIDDDLSNCGEDLKLHYDLHLVTDLSIELQKELDRRADANLVKALKDYTAPVFTDYARDLDLSFYDTQGDFARLHHEQHQMDANEMSFTIYLPRRQYRHLAVANVAGNGVTAFEGSDLAQTSQLRLSQDDNITPHKTGLFTARQTIHLEDGVSKTQYIHMYMVNCGAALVLDTSEAKLKGLKVVATGFATQFNIADSTYVFADNAPVVMTDKIDTKKDGQRCFCTINFPSREPDAAKTREIFDTEEPFFSVDAQDALWEFRVYATLPDGKVTESVLGVRKPLRAGQFKILHANVYENGGLEPDPDEPEVAVSITLDWKEAGHYETPL